MPLAKLPDPILEYFVDRESERGLYQEMVNGARFTRIFCVKAEDKGGKSWLLKRLRLEARNVGWPAAYIDLASADAENAESMLLSIARQMGGTVQQAVEEAQARVGQAMPRTDVHSDGALDVGGDIVGGNKVTVNTFGSQQHVTVEVVDRHGYQLRVTALTNAFNAALKALPEDVHPLLFLDQFESVNTDYVLPWLQRELFETLRSGDTDRPLLVIASKESFVLFADTEWEFATFCQELPGLPETAIRQYWLERRQLPESFLPNVLKVMSEANGLPGKLSELVWFYEQSQKMQAQQVAQSKQVSQAQPAEKQDQPQVGQNKTLPGETNPGNGTADQDMALKGADLNV